MSTPCILRENAYSPGLDAKGKISSVESSLPMQIVQLSEWTDNYQERLYVAAQISPSLEIDGLL